MVAGSKVHKSDYEWLRLTSSAYEWLRVTTSDTSATSVERVNTSDYERPREHEWLQVSLWYDLHNRKARWASMIVNFNDTLIYFIHTIGSVKDGLVLAGPLSRTSGIKGPEANQPPMPNNLEQAAYDRYRECVSFLLNYLQFGKNSKTTITLYSDCVVRWKFWMSLYQYILFEVEIRDNVSVLTHSPRYLLIVKLPQKYLHFLNNQQLIHGLADLYFGPLDGLLVPL